MTKFLNLKIAVENNLDEIVIELERLGYKNTYKTASKVATVITDKTTYSLLGLPCEIIDDRNKTTLAELKEMQCKI